METTNDSKPNQYEAVQKTHEDDWEHSVSLDIEKEDDLYGEVVMVVSDRDATSQVQLVNTGKSSLLDRMEQSYFAEKLTYMLSVACIILVACAMTSYQWLLPYIYLTLTAFLIPLRVWKYTQLKYQFFLFDWCYFSNALLVIYLVGIPSNGSLFMILFGLSNGPVSWAILTFRNCLVLHSADRMTSLTIHAIPALLTYVIRWHGAETSLLWFRGAFATVPGGEESLDGAEASDLVQEVVWLVFAPLGCYMLHSILYLIIIDGIVRPSEEYSNVYRYLVLESDGAVSKCSGCVGEMCRIPIFLALNWTYALLTLVLTWIWFHFQAAHIAYIITMVMIASYNGATYYMDLFAKKGLESDQYRVCGNFLKT